MSLTTGTVLQTLNTAFMGQPFVDVKAKTAVSTDGLDVAFMAEPFSAAGSGAGAGPGPGGSQNRQFFIGS